MNTNESVSNSEFGSNVISLLTSAWTLTMSVELVFFFFISLENIKNLHTNFTRLHSRNSNSLTYCKVYISVPSWNPQSMQAYLHMKHGGMHTLIWRQVCPDRRWGQVCLAWGMYTPLLLTMINDARGASLTLDHFGVVVAIVGGVRDAKKTR